MSASAQHTHRRRSRSASSPFTQPHRPSDDPNWRISVKRSRPSYRSSASYKEIFSSQPAEKWDVDQWRRGKRARRDSRQGCSLEHHSTISAPLSTQNANANALPITNLPSSSQAFNLFPRGNLNRSRKSSRSSIYAAASKREDTQQPAHNVDQLRSNAFWELQRSVAESGEGLVQSMRDWEYSRSRSPLAQDPWLSDRYRRRQEAMSGPLSLGELATMEDDDDEVEIVSGTIPDTRSPAPKKRAFSLGTMDIDLPDIDMPGAEVHDTFTSTDDSERCSSPIDLLSAPSACSSDDEEMSACYSEARSGPLSTPSLSHTHPSSTNSSLVSLPLTHYSPTSDLQLHYPPIITHRSKSRPTVSHPRHCFTIRKGNRGTHLGDGQRRRWSE